MTKAFAGGAHRKISGAAEALFAAVALAMRGGGA
jgi:hypothetical protein